MNILFRLKAIPSAVNGLVSINLYINEHLNLDTQSVSKYKYLIRLPKIYMYPKLLINVFIGIIGFGCIKKEYRTIKFYLMTL